MTENERKDGTVQESAVKQAPEAGTTELVFILDRSGSMAGLEADTVGGFNAMIEQQRQTPGKVLVSTVLFSNTSHVLHDRVPLEKIEPMTRQQYTVNGCTALMDAIGRAVSHIGNVHKYARPEDVPERTLFVITTDGMENASREYGSARVKEMIRRREEEDGWEFLFVAANIDAVETAANIGIRADHAAQYDACREGTRDLYGTLGAAVHAFRCSRGIEADWSKGLNKKKRLK